LAFAFILAWLTDAGICHMTANDADVRIFGVCFRNLSKNIHMCIYFDMYLHVCVHTYEYTQ
jgi:hypothetical protein